MTTKVIFITSGTTWVVPSDWNSSANTLEAIGGGGAGAAGNTTPQAGPGGGGGAYAKLTNAVLTPGSTVNIQIGSGGATSSATGTTTFLQNNSNAVILAADYGRGGDASTSTGGQGGLAANCAPPTQAYSGGAGGSATGGGAGGGGGGGAGGPLGVGGQGGANLGSISGGGGGGGNGGGGAGLSPSVAFTGGAGGNNNAGSGSGAGGGASTAGTAGTNGGGGGGGGNLANGAAGGAGTEWTSTAGPTGGSGGGGGGDGANATGSGGPGAGGLYGAGGAGSSNDSNFGVGANGIIVATYTATSSNLPEPPPSGYQYETYAGTPPISGADWLGNDSIPAVASGDVFIVSLTTSPSNFPISVNADGTYNIVTGGSLARQSFNFRIWRTASDTVDPPFTSPPAAIYDHEIAPIWAQAINITTPVNPTPSTVNLASKSYAYSQEGDALVFAVASGALPVGCPLLSTGLLTIAPTLPGTYNGTISATDTTGTSSTAPFTLVVQSGAATGTVPNVVGDTTAAAQTAIIAAGFPVGAVTSAPSTTAQEGFVISQAPSAGPGVLLTQPVSYVLGSGPVAPNPPVLELPNIVGQTQAEAQETLAEVGASVGMSTSSYDD